jgi:hypothetical protein
MGFHHMLSKAVLLSVLVLALGMPGLANAQDRGSAEDQQACEPDVHRLCDQYIPDEGQIVACLRKERRHLSPACAKVMAR